MFPKDKCQSRLARRRKGALLSRRQAYINNNFNWVYFFWGGGGGDEDSRILPSGTERYFQYWHKYLVSLLEILLAPVL
jgi:hypothetical protein